MKMFFKMIFALVCGSLLVLLALCCIDREVARRDWVENGVAENCLFDFNCDHYNEKN